jgi:hypothetical protein
VISAVDPAGPVRSSACGGPTGNCGYRAGLYLDFRSGPVGAVGLGMAVDVDHRHREAQLGMTPWEVVQSSRYTHFPLSRLIEGEATT